MIKKNDIQGHNSVLSTAEVDDRPGTYLKMSIKNFRQNCIFLSLNLSSVSDLVFK